ncbi:uncharacterized protein [Halyomorpha halys]|uniref:uncharacterized protein n=1 Tax=Halyomorpha halys TaxID=286706 RepID=UPI0006D50CCA|nr:uncharacterized protein LOC106684368 [Halyomorpha halys]
MRFSALVLFCLFWCVSATAGFVIRNIYYVNATEVESNRMPSSGSSLIQVKPSEKTPEKPKRIPESVSLMPEFHKTVETSRPADFRIKLPKKRIRRQLFSEEAVMRELEDLMMSGSTFERPRQERTLIQAPLFQGKSCPPGQKLDRARKKCRGPW